MTYRDRWIECTPTGIDIHGYYFPWAGTKRVPYPSIRSVRRVNIGLLNGRARIWGTANPSLWANLDPGRPAKRVGLILDLGGMIQPFLTPDDPDAVEAAIREHAGITADRAGRGPIV